VHRTRLAGEDGSSSKAWEKRKELVTVKEKRGSKIPIREGGTFINYARGPRSISIKQKGGRGREETIEMKNISIVSLKGPSPINRGKFTSSSYGKTGWCLRRGRAHLQLVWREKKGRGINSVRDKKGPALNDNAIGEEICGGREETSSNGSVGGVVISRAQCGD